MRDNPDSHSGMIVSNTRKCFDEEEDTKKEWRVIKLKIVLVLLISFSIIYFTCFGCFLVVNDTVAQTVTLSSEGGVDEMYPDSMGEYQLAEEEIEKMDVNYSWYRHKDRDDRFLMYNTLGNTE